MVSMICLFGALWLCVIASGLWTALRGLKAIFTRRAVLRNFAVKVTRLGPVRMEQPATRIEGDLAIRHGAIQLIGGLLIAGPLALVPLLGGGFPNTIFLGSAVGLTVAWIGSRIIKTRAMRADIGPPSP